jgi:integrase
MSNFTHSEPYIYSKDKKGKPVKKWCIRYSIQYPNEGKEYPKEYGNSYKKDLNRIRNPKTKQYEAEIILGWVEADLKNGIDSRFREKQVEDRIMEEIKASEQYKYADVFKLWFASMNYVNPIPSKEISAKIYKRFHENQFIPYLKSIGKEHDIRLIDDNDLNEFIQQHYRTGQWSAFTCNVRIGWLYGAFKFAFLKKLISVNPTKLIQKIKEDKIIIAEDGSEKIKQKKLARYNVYTQQELDIIFQKFHNTQWEVICKLVYYAFIRFSEIFRLKLEHLDLEKGYINIPAIIAKGQRDGELLTIKLFPNVLDALKRYLDYTFEKDLNPGYYLFFQNNDKLNACSYSIFQHFYRDALKEIKDELGVEITKMGIIPYVATSFAERGLILRPKMISRFR